LRRNLIILAVIAAALAGVGALAISKGPRPALGLDLAGGIEVVLQGEPAPGEEIQDNDLDTSVEVIRERIDGLGIAEPEIRKQGENQISVSLAEVFDPARASEIIGSTAKLEFYDLQGDAVPPSIDANGQIVPSPNLFQLISGLQESADEKGASQFYAFDESQTLIDGPARTEEALIERLEGGVLPAGAVVLKVPSDRIVLSCTLGEATGCPGGGAGTNYYLMQYQPNDLERPIPELTGEDLSRRGTRADLGGGGGHGGGAGANSPIVTMRFTGEGEDRFHDVTRELAQRGQFRANSLGIDPQFALQSFAIVLDGSIRSFPTIDYRTNPDGIPGGNGAIITGLDDLQEAQDLALVLQSGSLPLEFVQVDRTDISASLGKDSLREAWIAAIGGLLAVGLFLLVVYRLLGLVALAGLGIYGALLYGAILLFGVRLSLPGFAGLVLTIGVAVDSNIVIFERIKEEVRNGLSVRAAIQRGYKRGFSSIIDANVVTMITAFVIFAVATSGVRGFALMLLIGTIISLLTAVLATRALLGLLSTFNWIDNPRLMGATAAKLPSWQKIDFMGKRRLWAALSVSVVLVAILALGVKGLNLGIDFNGGSQIDFGTAQPALVQDVRDEAEPIVEGGFVVQGRGEEADGGGFTTFQIKAESLAAAQQDALQRGLTNNVGADSISFRTVSGSFSSQILQNAIIAVVISLLLIALYVTIRFQWRFAVPVLVALVHDIVIAGGIYALLGAEVSAPTVAAFLTILGYSVYDSIIVFDRVRENIPQMKRSSFAGIANQSLWEMLRRSIMTTVTTLLPVISLLIFGGATLKDFALALLVGIVAGAYSTIFVATPMLTWMFERDPEWAKRAAGGAMPVDKQYDSEIEDGFKTPPLPGLAPEPEPLTAMGGVSDPAPPSTPSAEATREDRRDARKKRRRSKPHGRAR
jgi:SecD/SecF fusion protein